MEDRDLPICGRQSRSLIHSHLGFELLVTSASSLVIHPDIHVPLCLCGASLCSSNPALIMGIIIQMRGYSTDDNIIYHFFLQLQYFMIFMQADLEREPWHIKGQYHTHFAHLWKETQRVWQFLKIALHIDVTVHKLDLFDIHWCPSMNCHSLNKITFFRF